MKKMYQEALHPASEKALKDKGLLKTFQAYRKEFVEYIGGRKYFAKPFHIPTGIENLDAIKPLPSNKAFALCGVAPDEFVHKALKEKFNSNKWFRMFAGIGLGLLAVSVVSQFFFGRMVVKND
jgi:hypothetical protein